MSPYHPWCSDMRACPCRTFRSGEATYAVENVAPLATVHANAMSLMSLHTTGSSDTLRFTCRSVRLGSATLSSMLVALHTGARRHIRAGMSPFTSSSSDMQGVECRASRGSGATCSRWHVARHDDPERHARAGMPRRTRVKRDMGWTRAYRRQRGTHRARAGKRGRLAQALFFPARMAVAGAWMEHSRQRSGRRRCAESALRVRHRAPRIAAG